MSEVGLPGPEAAALEPTWSQKIVSLNAELARLDVPYAFGGAIALNYHREPRATIDIDINVFLSPDNGGEVLAALSNISGLNNPEQLEVEIKRDGQTRTAWGSTHLDLFFANTAFHASMAERIAHEPFGDTRIPVLAIEDLLVCKALFDRPKDWLDIDAVVQTRGQSLDYAYVRRWLAEFISVDDQRFTRLRELSND